MNEITIACFVSCVRTGSFSLAAQRLSVTHQAISRNIQKLEDEIGHRLFIRTGRELSLTQAGHEFLAWVEDVDEHMQWADERFYMEENCTRKLRIVFPHWTGLPLSVDSALKSLRKSRPEVQAELISGSAEKEAQLLTELSADIYIVPRKAELLRLSPALFTAKIRQTTRFVLVVPRSVCKPDGTIDHARLTELPLLRCDLWEETNQQIQRLFFRLCTSDGHAGIGERLCPNFRSVLSEIAMGNGFSFLPESFDLTSSCGNLVAVETLPDSFAADIPLSCIWQLEDGKEDDIAWFVERLCGT